MSDHIIAAGLVGVGVLAFLLLRRRGGGKRGLVALQGADHKIALKLIEREEISHDTRRFRFALPSEKHILGLPIGQHMSLSYTDGEGKLVSRSYTPTTSDDERGYVDFVIKVYFANVHPKFPNGGMMSQHLESLKLGDTIDVRGPKGRLEYLGMGKIAIKPRPSSPPEIRHAKAIGMIAGGTGITPMLQIVRAILKNPNDTTEMYLLFANQTENDILVKQELDDCSLHPRFHLAYTLDRPPPNWKGESGFVNEDMLRRTMPAHSPSVQIFMCGPPPMINFACVPNLEKLGFKEDQYFAF